MIGDEYPHRTQGTGGHQLAPNRNRGMHWVIGEETPRRLVPRSYREPNPGLRMYDRDRDEFNRATTIQRYVRGRQTRSPRGRVARQREAIEEGYGGPLDVDYHDSRRLASRGYPSYYHQMEHVDRMDRDDYMRFYGVPYWRSDEV